MDINELKKHLFIVIGYEHYNPLGVIRSLGEYGIRPVVILLKQDIRIASLSRYIRRLYRVNSNEEAIDILLNEYGDEIEKPFVFPCDDNITELVDKNYDVLKEKFFIPNAGEKNRITHFMDKWNILLLAQKSGLNILKSWNVKKGEIPNDIAYPIITKPLTSYPDWKNDYYVCNDESELITAYSKITRDDDLLLQQYITKVNELCLDGCAIQKGKKVLVTISSTYTYVLPDYYSMEMIVKNFDDSYLQSVLETMFAEIGYEGIFSVEFMIDRDGKLWFLEINFRNSTWSWASTKLNMNLPLIWSEGMLSEKIDEQVIKPVPNDYVALAEVADFAHRVKRLKMISFFQWLKGVIRANCLYVWDKKDKLPCIIYWCELIMRTIKKKFRGGTNASL